MKNQLKSLLGLELKSLLLPSFLGAIIPSSLLIFLMIANPESFELWMLFPLLIIPTGGAIGGIFFYLMGFHWFPKGNQKLIALIFSCLIYVFIIWIFSVMAFNITGHWD
ncbi:hypothetical protein [Algoriphagus zhangzhouensis]|uniref:Uncharacterized protein n=1 Tax=Algoriphagus zhangzhouensis TaxID=1073327 RepID=A0A1M7ZH46_9BACT|nr:hypothetical protein [Algoriphagus zhangzhouensis]TDY44109.1 hypothetical protein A8938_3319 [Algoriphagus zhangzhouensis]SHO64235.1 hypothetical protein SAMN04488108_3314 [Algoriphagus zhangzhouensis]